MTNFTEYIKTHAGPNFDIIACFNTCDINDQEAAEKTFMETIKGISNWMSNSRIQQWALEQVNNNFVILKSNTVDEYWEKKAIRRAQMEETKQYFRYKAVALQQAESSLESNPEGNSKRKFDDFERTHVDPEDLEDLIDDQDKSLDDHKKRKYVYDYLTDVTKDWSPGENWIVDGFNITNKLKKFRKRTISLAPQENLRDIRVLSLSHIFFMSPNQAESCLHRFSRCYHEAITRAHSCKEGWQSLPMRTRHWCAAMDEKIGSSATFPTKKLRAMVRRFGDEADGDNNEDDDEGDLLLMALLLAEMVEKFHSWSDDWVLESTFIQQHLSPFMKQVFGQNHLMNTRQGETHVMNKSDSLLADYFVYHKAPTGNIFDIIAVEVKVPSKTSEGQLQSDFVKLGKEMKDILDILADYGLKDPVAGGILVKGYSATTYTLRLVSDGVYLMSLHGKFELLRSPADVSNIPKIVEHFVQLRTLVHPTVLAIDERSDSESGSIPGTSQWRRPSAPTPLRTQQRR